MKLAYSRKNLWDKAPRVLTNTIGRLLGVVPPAYLLGRRFRAMLRFVDEAQWWSAERAREFQLQRLRAICTLAYEGTSYYRRTFDAIGFHPAELKDVEDIAALPTIDKETVRENTGQMMVGASNAHHIDYVSTGGSSGMPLRFYIGADRSATEYAYLVSSWRRFGYRLDVPLAVFRGRIVPENRHGLRHEYDPLLGNHTYSNFHMSDASMNGYLKHIATIGPCFLHAYPSAVDALARYVRRSGAAVPANINGIIAESEIVFPDQRRYAEEVFKCRLSACYGHCEKLVLAAECEHTSHYHVWPTYGYFELLDEDGLQVTTPGQRGEIVGTGFINTVVPFIRYRTGDHATYVDDHCDACGRQHTVIEDIRGHRTHEMLVACDNSPISWTALNMHDDTFANVRQFQFRQDVPGRAVLRIVPAEGFSEQDERRIIRNLDRKLDGRIQVEIKRVESINLTPVGKAIYVDQRIPKHSDLGDSEQIAVSEDS